MRTGRRASYDPELPSVTELLEEAGYGYDGPPDNTGYYRQRGIWVNGCADLLAQGQRLNSWTKAQNELVREKPLVKKDENKQETWGGYVTAYQQWLMRHKEAKLIACQKYVVEPRKYQGTFDQLVELDEGLTMIDLKTMSTGAAPKWTALQTAAYDIANDVRSKKRMGLALHADGTFNEQWYTNYRDFDAWRNLVEHHWMHGDRSEYR